MTEERDEILMQSTTTPAGHASVQLRWGDKTCQLTPEEARQHALAIMECAEAAIMDAAVLRFMTEELKLPRDKVAHMIFDLRRFRGDSTRKDWRGD